MEATTAIPAQKGVGKFDSNKQTSSNRHQNEIVLLTVVRKPRADEPVYFRSP